MNRPIHKMVEFMSKTQVAEINDGLSGKKDPSETMVQFPVNRADVISATVTLNCTLFLIYCFNLRWHVDSKGGVADSGALPIVSRSISCSFCVR